jgi:putative transposase
VQQCPHNLFLHHGEQLTGSRALVSDRGAQFVEAFDEVLRTEGLKSLKTPVPTPVANAFAERWIGSIRRELLDRTIAWNRRRVGHAIESGAGRRTAHTQERGPGPARPRRSSGFAIQHSSNERQPHPMHFVSPARRRCSSVAL